MAHVHAIDNDMAFGTVIDQEANMKWGSREGQKGLQKSYLRMVVDSDDNLTIPHMERQLAINIKNTKPDEVKFAIKDLIEPEFVEYTLKRYIKLRNAVIKELNKTDSTVFVDENGWGKQTHDDFMNNSFKMKLAKRTNNYNAKEGDLDAYSADDKYELQKNDSYYSYLVSYMHG